MLHKVPNETLIHDPALIEKVAIAIFERTQGSWEYARDADRQWLRLEAQAAIVTVLRHIEERDQIPAAARFARRLRLFGPIKKNVLEHKLTLPGRQGNLAV